MTGADRRGVRCPDRTDGLESRTSVDFAVYGNRSAEAPPPKGSPLKSCNSFDSLLKGRSKNVLRFRSEGYGLWENSAIEAPDVRTSRRDGEEPEYISFRPLRDRVGPDPRLPSTVSEPDWGPRGRRFSR